MVSNVHGLPGKEIHMYTLFHIQRLLIAPHLPLLRHSRYVCQPSLPLLPYTEEGDAQLFRNTLSPRPNILSELNNAAPNGELCYRESQLCVRCRRARD